MTYLACPYSHPSVEVRERRYHAANKAFASLMKSGVQTYSPISHTHQASVDYGLPTDWKFWERNCTEFISICDRLIVLTIDGWRESVGVQAEIEIAQRLGIQIEYMEAE